MQHKQNIRPMSTPKKHSSLWKGSRKGALSPEKRDNLQKTAKDSINFNREDRIGFWLNGVSRKFLYGLSRSFNEKGFHLSTEQFALLTCLWIKDGKRQSDIADELEKDRTGITRIIDNMEKNGLVERRTHENDRRSYRIYLTELGRNMKSELISIEKEWDKISTSGLSDKQKEEFKQVLKIIGNNISKYFD